MSQPTSSRPHTFSRTQSSITREARRRSARIQRNRTAIRLVPSLLRQLTVMGHENTAERERFAVAMAISSRGIFELSRRLERQERQLRAVTSNLHHALRCLSAWERGVCADDASRHIWRLRNATRDILGNAEYLGDFNSDSDNDSNM